MGDNLITDLLLPEKIKPLRAFDVNWINIICPEEMKKKESSLTGLLCN